MFIEEGKTNWLFLFIVVLCAFAAGATSLVCINNGKNEIVVLGQGLENIRPVQKNQADISLGKNGGNSLPTGHTLESYSVEKTLDALCSKNSDCQTPPEYLIQSRCPFVSICINNKCTVVCPDYKK